MLIGFSVDRVFSVAPPPPSPRSTTPDSPKSDDLVELHLPLVLFPGAILPLQIFKFRYQMMMHTLLQTDLRFGVIYYDTATGITDVGEVVKHESLIDDRFFLICKGQEGFRVSSIVRTKPYLVAKVNWLEDRPSADGDNDLEALANEVEVFMKDVICLSNRLNGKPETEAQDLRRNLFSELSGNYLSGSISEISSLSSCSDSTSLVLLAPHSLYDGKFH